MLCDANSSIWTTPDVQGVIILLSDASLLEFTILSGEFFINEGEKQPNEKPRLSIPRLLMLLNQKSVLLVSQPGIMHNTLYSILQSLPDTSVAEANGALSAYDYLESEQVDAVLIDANIPLAERLALLARIKGQFPHVRSLVLTLTARHHNLLCSAGADKVLLQNCSLADIEAAVFAR